MHANELAPFELNTYEDSTSILTHLSLSYCIYYYLMPSEFGERPLIADELVELRKNQLKVEVVKVTDHFRRICRPYLTLINNLEDVKHASSWLVFNFIDKCCPHSIHWSNLFALSIMMLESSYDKYIYKAFTQAYMSSTMFYLKKPYTKLRTLYIRSNHIKAIRNPIQNM